MTIPSADAPTAAAIGVLSGLLMFLAHELLGHGVATLICGAHIMRVTSVKESWSSEQLPGLSAHVIAAAGIAANLFYGALALVALRQLPKAHAPTRFFLWFFGHATIFMGSGYLVAVAMFGFGDVPQVLNGVPFGIAWRIGLSIIGFLIFFFARLDAERTLVAWAGTQHRSERAQIFAIVPYLAMGSAATLSGLVGPDLHYSDVGWSALATFAASLPFALLPLGLPTATIATEPLNLPRSPGWIGAGVLALVLLFFILAPGVPR